MIGLGADAVAAELVGAAPGKRSTAAELAEAAA